MQVLIGLCQGYYSETRQIRGANGQSEITEHSVLVDVEVPNKFGMMEQKTMQVRLSKKHMDSGVHNVWNQLKGKQACVPVFVQAWASKSGNAGYDLWLSGDGRPVPLVRQAATAAAS